MNKKNIGKFTEFGIASTLLASLILTACGGSGGGDSGSSGTSVTVTPALGQFQEGTTVIVKDKNGNQIGSGTVASNGRATMTIPANATGPFVFEVGKNGDKYFDEKAGAITAISGVVGAAIRSVLPDTSSAASGVAITTLTEIAARGLMNASGVPLTGITAASAIGANSAVAQTFGMNSLLAPPKPVSGVAAVAALSNSNHEDQYALKLAALANMAQGSERAHDVAIRLSQAMNQSNSSSAVAAANQALSDMKTAMMTIPGINSTVASAVVQTVPSTPLSKPLATLANENGTIATSATAIAEAKKLLSSLRTNARLVSNNTRTGFADTQFKTIKADLKNEFMTLTHSGLSLPSIGMMNAGADLLFTNAATGSYRMVPLSMQNAPCVTITSGSRVVCQWLQSDGSNWAMHQTIFDKTSSNTMIWSESLIGKGVFGGSSTGESGPTIYSAQSGVNVAGSLTTLSTYPAKTGTITSTYVDTMPSGTLVASGNYLPNLPQTSPYAHIAVALNMNASTTSQSIGTISFDGSIAAVDTSAVTRASLTLKSGSEIVFNVATDKMISGKFITQMKTTQTQFDGTISASNFTRDLGGEYPQDISFTGAVTLVGTGELLNGTFAVKQLNTSYDPLKPDSSTNFEQEVATFVGTLTNRTVTPATTYKLDITADASKVYGKTDITLIYTDATGNVVTVTGIHYKGVPSSGGTAKLGGIVIANNQIHAGTQLIATISKNVVSFIDGTYESF